MNEDDARYVNNLRRSHLSIYDPVDRGNLDLWIPTDVLERILDECLKGHSVSGLPLRTRSKVIKVKVCRALGYDAPFAFRRIRPRFPGQDFDTYIQKSDNLQVWNEQLVPARRYVLIRVDECDRVVRVKVVTGDTLAFLDTTGTLTQKYQARFLPSEDAELVSPEDTDNVKPLLSADRAPRLLEVEPTHDPLPKRVLPIKHLFEILKALLGARLAKLGSDQERNRGAQLHQMVCTSLGFSGYKDDGRFPDIRNQLLEIKLQTSPTIDLGLVRPDSNDLLDMPPISGTIMRHCDIRYAVFYAVLQGDRVELKNLIVTTGQKFFTRFQLFEGRVLNKKLQIPLPFDFFLT